MCICVSKVTRLDEVERALNGEEAVGVLGLEETREEERQVHARVQGLVWGV